MSMKLLSFVLLALSVHGQDNEQLPAAGSLLPGFVSTSGGRSVFEATGRQPNWTDLVQFERTYNNQPESWGLRINVTDLPVPNRISELGKTSADFSQGLRVANIQYELQWPGDKEVFQELLRERNLSVTIYTRIINLPGNVTNRFDPGRGGSCVGILGEQCTQSLTDATSRNSLTPFARSENCEDTLGVAEETIRSGAKIGKRDPDIDERWKKLIEAPELGQNAANVRALNRSGTLFYRTSETYTANNLTAVDRSITALQIFTMNFEHISALQSAELSGGASVLCRIVDKPTQRESGAIRWRERTVLVWSMVLLSILVAY